MKRPLLVLLCCLLSAGGARAAERSDPLASLRWLEGRWSGVGEGEPGVAAADRSIACLLDCRYLRVEARSVYPKQDKNPKGEIHRSMDVWSFDRHRDSLVLRTFDNLGFVTTYVEDKAARTASRIVLIAEHLENVPRGWRARYTYTFSPPDQYRELFELDPGGKGYEPYSSSNFLRMPEPEAPRGR